MHQQADKLSSSKGFSLRQVILCENLGESLLVSMLHICCLPVWRWVSGWPMFMDLFIVPPVSHNICKFESYGLPGRDGVWARFLNSVMDLCYSGNRMIFWMSSCYVPVQVSLIWSRY